MADRDVNRAPGSPEDHPDGADPRRPALPAAIAALPFSTLILDGEVCIFDQQLVSRFEWLRHGKPPGLTTPPTFMTFDCLLLSGEGDLRDHPLAGRRDILDRLLEGQTFVWPLGAWPITASRCGSRWSRRVAKDPGSKYVAGRTLQWLKVKQPQYRVGSRA